MSSGCKSVQALEETRKNEYRSSALNNVCGPICELFLIICVFLSIIVPATGPARWSQDLGVLISPYDAR